MDLFHSILSGIQKKLSLETEACAEIARIATNVLGFTVKESMVIQKKGEIVLKLPPTGRLALAIKRQELLLALQNSGIAVTSLR